MRTACATSAPVGQTGFVKVSASIDPRPLGGDRGDVGELQRIAGLYQQPLLATGKSNDHGIVQAGRGGHRVRIGLVVITLEPVQMNGGGEHLGAGEPPQPFLAAFRKTGKAAAAFAQRPFQQRIVTAADDQWRRICPRRTAD
jgi:hypothetical protein